jgi:light-regulated signal transduction histidine kinase (bacteriophytochrome)
MKTEQLQRDLLQARAELADFTHTVSHDLRASLRHVNAFAQIIREDLEAQNTTDIPVHLARIEQAALQMGQQIEGLTALSRLASVELQLKPVNVLALVRDVYLELRPVTEGRSVECQFADDFPLLQCDAPLIRQVLTLLLSNALKFTRTRPVAHIQVTWQADGAGACTVTVADNGVGFNPDYAAKLFHPFSRLHAAKDFEGLGMGLAIAAKILSRHQGRIWAEGAQDGGCRVSFTLPRA